MATYPGVTETGLGQQLGEPPQKPAREDGSHPLCWLGQHSEHSNNPSRLFQKVQ
jgi:hypothetical protein